jgi:hypothetical protein
MLQGMPPAVVDVPSKFVGAGTRVRHRTGTQNDPVDAHSVAVVAVRSNGLRHATLDKRGAR